MCITSLIGILLVSVGIIIGISSPISKKAKQFLKKEEKVIEDDTKLFFKDETLKFLKDIEEEVK